MARSPRSPLLTSDLALCAAALLLFLLLPPPPVAAQSLLAGPGGAGDFPLVAEGRAAVVWYDTAEATVVGIAARDFAADVERVTGLGPRVVTDEPPRGTPAVLVGTLGRSRLVDELVRAGKLDVGEVRGKWETFVIATVADPLPGLSRALVVAGSDRRGTAFGVYELSRQIGVSPWYWWADVPPKTTSSLFVRAGATRMGPPSVKYRGIFLNDEDWGLHPWASRTYEPEVGDIGPRTYARVFELLLRLKANTLWPAMHPTTRAFNLYPRNPVVADDYAIVMGSSHAEPMLRNNVSEWTAPASDYDYLTNREGVLGYWEERVAENGRYESLYTIGMRGIHDSGMRGGGTMADRVALLERIFADQRALLAEHVDPDPGRVPQIFVPYKEVLPLYRAGLDVPDDVTIVWPDDNFGYIRAFPGAGERRRPGGSGVYYHLSYLGAPMAYLWLYTTPPALVWQEMSKAYDHGARTLWIANVGDLKPAEIGVDFFLQMAWDVERWQRDNLPDYLADWATRQFGPEHAAEVADVLGAYYRLNFQRRPEHLQWWLPGQRPRSHPLGEAEVRARLAAFRDLVERVDRLEAAMPPAARDAFFELVAYPVRGAALSNQRYFYGEAYARSFEDDLTVARAYAARARRADARLREETRRYNEDVAGGKWRHFMAEEPADNLWRQFRLAPALVPSAGMASDTLLPVPLDAAAPGESATPGSATPAPSGPPRGFAEVDGVVSIPAERFTGREGHGGVAWDVIPGLGHTGASVAVFPTTAASVDPTRAPGSAPRLDYRVRLSTPGTAQVTVSLIPTFPLREDRGLRFAVGLDDGPPEMAVVDVEVDSPAWARGVLDNTLTATVELDVPAAGEHTLKVYMVDPGVVLDTIVMEMGGNTPPSS